jgi:tetratricopeptide (TPR) repeat protein
LVEFSSPGAARLYLANSSTPGCDRLAIAERGYALRYTDPAAMLAWCEAAAVNLPPSLPPSEAAVLLAHVGNAHRVSSDFSEAENYLRQALKLAPDEPLVLEFFASLMKDRRQLETAAELLARAAMLRRGLGANPALAATLLQSALVLDEAGLASQAAISALGAIDIIGSLPPSDERERLARAGFQSLATYLVNSGNSEGALWVVRKCKSGLMQGGEVFRLRVDWLMADIAGAFGEIESAVVIYQRVRKCFAALGHSQEVAVVTLDLARLLLESDPQRAKEEALSVASILEELGIGSESREVKLLAEVVETGNEVALVELSTALRCSTLARRRA